MPLRSFNENNLNARRNPLRLSLAYSFAAIDNFRASVTLPSTPTGGLRGAHRGETRGQAASTQGGSQRSLSLFVLVGVLLLEVGGDRLHDLLSLALVVHGVGVEVPWGAQLQLGHASLSILLDCDLIRLGEVRLLPSHHLDEFFQVLDFLGLDTKTRRVRQSVRDDDDENHLLGNQH